MLVNQIDAHLGNVRPLLQAGTTQQAIEVDHAGFAHRGFISADFIKLAHHVADTSRHIIGVLQRGAFRHFNTDNKSIGVVLRQHFELHITISRQRHHRRHQTDNKQTKQPARAAAFDQATHDGDIATFQNAVV